MRRLRSAQLVIASTYTISGPWPVDRKSGFPFRTRLLLGFQGTKTARREGTTRQRRAFIADLHRFDRRIEQSGARFIGADGSLVGMRNPWISGVAVQEEFGGPIVIRRSQKAVPGADAMAAGKLSPCLLGGPLRGRVPGVVPAIVVAGLYPRGRRQDFAELAPAIFVRAKDAQRLVPELDVLGEQRRLTHRSTSSMREHRTEAGSPGVSQPVQAGPRPRRRRSPAASPSRSRRATEAVRRTNADYQIAIAIAT